MKPSELKNLGYMNGWRGSPPTPYLVHEQFTDLPHEVEVIDLNGRGTHKEYRCFTCGIKYRVDSSD